MIVTENLTKQYGKQLALNNVDVTIKKNSITGLIGPNGAGKSTLMKLICGYISPTKGKVTIDGTQVEGNDPEIKRKIGYLPENNPLYQDMYVKEYLAYVADIYKIKNKNEKIKDIISLTGLEKEQHKKIEMLSKGYKQRVGLAQAIIHDPQIIILDEPTSGLDPNQIIEIRNVISELGKDKTVLLSTHILQEVEAICHQVIIVNEGKIVASNQTSEIQDNPYKNIVVEFDKNPDPEKILDLEGIVHVKNVKENVWIISCEKDKDIRSSIFKFAVDHGLMVLSSQVQEHTLEEIFQQLTKR